MQALNRPAWSIECLHATFKNFAAPLPVSEYSEVEDKPCGIKSPHVRFDCYHELACSVDTESKTSVQKDVRALFSMPAVCRSTAFSRETLRLIDRSHIRDRRPTSKLNELTSFCIGVFNYLIHFQVGLKSFSFNDARK